MKIAIIGSRGIPARYGGFEVFAERLAQSLSEKKHYISVYSLPEFSNISFDSTWVKRIFIKSPRLSSLEKVYMSSVSTINSVLKEKVDAVIFLGVTGGLFMWLPKILSIRTLLNVDGLEWRRARWGKIIQFSLKFLERYAVKWSDFVIADSEAIGEYIKDEYKKDFIFIPYGIDECQYMEEHWNEVRSKYKIESGEYYLIVGRHVPENNFDISIHGFLESHSPKKLLVVSNLKKREIVQNDKVIFTGPIYNRPKLFALRANTFAYIHGHSVGGTNPSLLEAISSRNIILAYDVPYNREVLEDSGYYFKKERELSYLINFLENDIDKINREKIYQYYETIRTNKYNWEIVLSKYEELLNQKNPA